jgi:hypothetical protein
MIISCSERQLILGSVDNTLELLYNASHTRGVPHLVTRSLAFAIEDERQRALEKLALRKEWQPANPQNAAQGQKTLEKKKKHEQLQRHSLGALDEIVRMAEASGDLILGPNSVPLGRYVHRRSRR